MHAYLGLDVVKGWRADDGKADEEDIGLRIGERSESVIIFLSSSVPKSQADRLAINHDTRGVVVEAAMETLVSVALVMTNRSVGRGPRRAGELRKAREDGYDKMEGRPTYTVGMYSPGKAFVV